MDQYLGGFPWLVIGVVELFCISWIYGKETILFWFIFIGRFLGVDNFCDDIALMLGEARRPSKFWKICWQYISPLILIVIIFLHLFIREILHTYVYVCFSLQFTILFSSLFYQEVTLDDYKYPSWALTLGWLVVILCLGWLPYIFLVEICRRGTWNVC